MINNLSEITKQKIKKVIDHIINNYLEEDSTSYINEPFADYPPLLIERVSNLAIEDFCEKFDQIEFGYELLQEYYDKNGNIRNLPKLKKLSCEYAKTLN